MRPEVTATRTDQPRLAFWVGVAVGWPMMAFGAVGLVDGRRTMPAEVARFIVGGAIAHDLVLVPLVALVATVVLRRLRPALRRAGTTFLVAAAPIALFAFPLVRGDGRRPGNASALPGNYARGLVLTLAVVASAVAVAWLVQRRRATRRSGKPAGHPAG